MSKSFFLIPILAIFFSLSGEAKDNLPLSMNNTAHKGWDVLDKPIRRAHWVWQKVHLSANDVQKKYLDFYQNKSISDVYLYIGNWQTSTNLPLKAELDDQEKLATFISKANARGIKVWGLYYLWESYLDANGKRIKTLNYMGDVSAKEHIRVGRTIAKAVGKFNQKYPDAGLHGIQNDQEPKVAPFFIPLIEYHQALFEEAKPWNARLLKQGARPFKSSAAYRNQWLVRDFVSYEGKKAPLAYHLLKVTHQAALMNYNNNVNGFITMGEKYLQLADSLPGEQTIVIGIETAPLRGMWPGAENETYAEIIAAENDTNRFNKFEADMDKAEHIFKQYKSYERLAIHSGNYIKAWFDGHDIADITSAPSDTVFVDLSIDQSPSATKTLTPNGLSNINGLL
ncbi:MAG: hypothetical protein OQK09_00300 [Colwellia sp.]|nr:hypothetical protein [Colwellia sp.]MCW9079927.1 hypothetical protein [Colwellia sp.]